jgi:hypothetical protein
MNDLQFARRYQRPPIRRSGRLISLQNEHPIDDGDCGAIDGMKIGRGNRSTRRKLSPMCTTNPT